MPPKIRVAVFGATGRSASSIIDALHESPETFEITAFSRSCSFQKPQNALHRSRGIHVLPYDLTRPNQDALVSVLRSIDVVVSALGPDAILDQIPLARASRAAGVERFVPAMYAPCAPAVGVLDARELKEEVLNHVKRIGLGYTVIDVGCWYEHYTSGLPRLGAATAAQQLSLPGLNVIPGTGDVLGALTSFRDVGRWVARVIADPRTLNKMVFACGDVLTANQAFDIVDRVAGVHVSRNYFSGEDLLAAISEARALMRNGVAVESTARELRLAQSMYSYGVRGDNTPWTAKYLGYLNAAELYPDFRPVSFEEFVKGAVAGEGPMPCDYVGTARANVLMKEYVKSDYDSPFLGIGNCPPG
ncbi:isoflavone reductase [Macrophomina phaseolina]|uniref:Isoflavone reductase n=1 Tax=Macrophomina phaseolina TaxID=35725 RepID=A0ABQ8GL27_9PEZI|nr:isoflavone reductase [Macrophomina phaseolina]